MNNNPNRGSSRKEKKMNAIIKTLLAAVLVALGLPMTACAAETELINSNTPWRVWMVMGKAASSGPDGVTSFREFTDSTVRATITEKNAELTRHRRGGETIFLADWCHRRRRARTRRFPGSYGEPCTLPRPVR